MGKQHDDSPKAEFVDVLRKKVKAHKTVQGGVNELLSGLANNMQLMKDTLKVVQERDGAAFDMSRFWTATQQHIDFLKTAAKMAGDDVAENTGH